MKYTKNFIHVPSEVHKAVINNPNWQHCNSRKGFQHPLSSTNENIDWNETINENNQTENQEGNDSFQWRIWPDKPNRTLNPKKAKKACFT